MRRIAIAIAVVLSGLVAACGQQTPAAGGPGAPAAELDFIEAVPISEEDTPAPVARPVETAKKDEPEAEKANEETTPAEAAPAPARVATPAPTAPANDAASATRRANEAAAPRSDSEVPYSPN